MSEVSTLAPREFPPVSQLTLIKYAAASGDFNPIHWDDATAREMGLGGVIAHGMLSMGLLGQYVLAAVDGLYTRRLATRFRAMVKIGDVLTCHGRILDTTADSVILEIWVETQAGQVVVSGEAEVVTAAGGA